MRSPRAIVGLCCLLLAIGALAGCGGGSDSSSSSTASVVESHPAPPRGEFPSAKGKTLAEVLETEEAKPSQLVVSPAAQVFDVGENRYPFGVFERDRTQVPNAEVALYFAHVPAKAAGQVGAKAEAEGLARDQPAIGPFPASVETLETKPRFRAKTTVGDPDAAAAVYVTHVDFPSKGEWAIGALVREDGKLTASLMPSAVVGVYKKVPRVGQKAPVIHTPTPSDAGGDLAKITTRIPPDTQNEVDYADVLGKKPIVLLFATPQFCQSRVCGPVVDVAEQVHEEFGDKAQFIHMEIYNENDPNKGARPQVKAFHLPGEPFLFAIGRDGRVKAVVDGAFGLEELTRVVKKLEAE